MSSTNRLIVAILVIGALAVGFWVLLLGPKREQAAELSQTVDSLETGLVQAQNEVAVAEEAKRAFPEDYRQLVSLGEAVPEGDETSSLLVELSAIAQRSKVRFEGLQLNSQGGGEEVAPPPAPVETAPPAGSSSGAVPAAATVPPTEAAAALLPLGASIGPAGLAVMPYTLTFSGDFFQVADFIAGIDRLIETEEAKVGVEGRLVTIDGFSLSAGAESEGGGLDASFVVTTFVTPPEQGVTAGATPTEPAPAAPASSPESEPAAETVAAQ